MTPAHRNFDGSQSVMSRQVQQFRVKPESFNPLLLKNNPAALPPKRFEAALRIHKRQTQHEAHNFIEDDAGGFTENRLASADQTPIHGSRSEGHVVAII